MGNFDFIFDKEKKALNSVEKIEGRFFISKTKKEIRLINRYDELDKLFPEIQNDTAIHLISSDNFGSIELLNVLVNRLDIKYIGITTWSYNTNFVEVIKSILIKGIHVDFFVDKSMKTRKSSLYAQMVNLRDEYKNLKIKVHHMLHAKITIIESDKHNISIEASANYSNNQRIENFTITENKELFNFHKTWMNEIINK